MQIKHPVYSFIYPNSKKRYFQFWDPVTGYPSTIPIDLITLIQYKGIYDKEFIGAVFLNYNQLITLGFVNTKNHDFELTEMDPNC